MSDNNFITIPANLITADLFKNITSETKLEVISSKNIQIFSSGDTQSLNYPESEDSKPVNSVLTNRLTLPQITNKKNYFGSVDDFYYVSDNVSDKYINILSNKIWIRLLCTESSLENKYLYVYLKSETLISKDSSPVKTKILNSFIKNNPPLTFTYNNNHDLFSGLLISNKKLTIDDSNIIEIDFSKTHKQPHWNYNSIITNKLDKTFLDVVNLYKDLNITTEANGLTLEVNADTNGHLAFAKLNFNTPEKTLQAKQITDVEYSISTATERVPTDYLLAWNNAENLKYDKFAYSKDSASWLPFTHGKFSPITTNILIEDNYNLSETLPLYVSKGEFLNSSNTLKINLIDETDEKGDSVYHTGYSNGTKTLLGTNGESLNLAENYTANGKTGLLGSVLFIEEGVLTESEAKINFNVGNANSIDTLCVSTDPDYTHSSYFGGYFNTDGAWNKSSWSLDNKTIPTYNIKISGLSDQVNYILKEDYSVSDEGSFVYLENGVLKTIPTGTELAVISGQSNYVSKIYQKNIGGADQPTYISGDNLLAVPSDTIINLTNSNTTSGVTFIKGKKSDRFLGNPHYFKNEDGDVSEIKSTANGSIGDFLHPIVWKRFLTKIEIGQEDFSNRHVLIPVEGTQKDFSSYLPIPFRYPKNNDTLDINSLAGCKFQVGTLLGLKITSGATQDSAADPSLITSSIVTAWFNSPLTQEHPVVYCFANIDSVLYYWYLETSTDNNTVTIKNAYSGKCNRNGGENSWNERFIEVNTGNAKIANILVYQI